VLGVLGFCGRYFNVWRMDTSGIGGKDWFGEAFML
jgi:hypothetical protein